MESIFFNDIDYNPFFFCLDDGLSLTTEEIASHCFIFFLSGLEVSPAVITFALYELSLHPEIQERVREEAIRVSRKYNDEICYESLVELEFLQQVIDGNCICLIFDMFVVVLLFF